MVEIERNRGLSLLNLYCSPDGDAWRVYLRPCGAPASLRACADEYGEAYPVQLDFEELDRHMRVNGAAYQKQTSAAGGVELTARGPAAEVLGSWLLNMLGTSIRPRSPRRAERAR
jgi:hypothetical protein